MFRTTTINLKPSIDQSVGAGGEIRVPWTFFFNSGAIVDAGGLVCDTATAFGQAVPLLGRTSYNDALLAQNFRLEQPGVYEKKPGDTHFAFLTPEPPRTDNDLIFNLVRQNIVSRRFAATMLLVDVPNPVYSRIREALYSVVPDWFIGDISKNGIEAQITELFKSLHDAGGQSELAQRGLAEFLELWASPQINWKMDACAKLEGYLKNVGERWRGGNYLPYFRLLGARRETFFSSDHQNLKESHLLFPKSETNPDLVMEYNGSVRAQ